MSDLQSFALSFGIVWLGLGAYLLRLRALAAQLKRRAP